MTPPTHIRKCVDAFDSAKGHIPARVMNSPMIVTGVTSHGLMARYNGSRTIRLVRSWVRSKSYF